MRGSKAATLRGHARARTVGKPWRAYVARLDKQGRTIGFNLHPDCGRAVYQRLKGAA